MNQAALRLDRLESLLDVVGQDAPAPGKELIPVAGAGLRLLFSRDGADLRKRRLLMTLIRDDRLHTDDVRALVGLLGRTFGPGRLAGGPAAAPQPPGGSVIQQPKTLMELKITTVSGQISSSCSRRRCLRIFASPSGISSSLPVTPSDEDHQDEGQQGDHVGDHIHLIQKGEIGKIGEFVAVGLLQEHQGSTAR